MHIMKETNNHHWIFYNVSSFFIFNTILTYVKMSFKFFIFKFYSILTFYYYYYFFFFNKIVISLLILLLFYHLCISI